MRLSTKILTATLLPFLAIITLYYFLTAGASFNYLAEAYRQQAANNLKKAEDDIRLSIADKERQLKFLASINPLNQKNPTASKVAIHILLHDIETFSQISVINTNGQEWLRLDKFPLARKEQNPVSLFSSPIYQQPMLELKTYLGNIQWHEGYQLPFIDLSIPVRDRMTDKIDGVLWARISFQEIQSLLESYLPAQGKLMLVQAGTGRLLAEADDTKFDFSDLESGALADVMSQKGKKSGTLEKSQDNLNITFIYRVFNLDDLRFILLYYQPNERIFSLANKLRNNNIYITLGGIFLFGLINFLLISVINTPLRTLTNKIRGISHHYRLKSGKEQDEIAIIKGDEVRQLESVFDFFQKQLSVYSEEIETFNQTLGEQVWRKTEELRRQLHERERAEKALRQSEEKFSKAFLMGPDSILITRISDGQIINANEQFYITTGYQQDEVIGKTSSEVNNWAKPEDRETFVRMLADTGQVDNLETYFRHKDGAITPCLISARLIDVGDEECAISITRDITALKEAEEAKVEMKVQLLQAHGAGMAEMAAEVLHNIGNAITPAYIASRSLIKTLRSSPLSKILADLLNEFRDVFELSPSVPQDKKDHLAEIAEKLPGLIRNEFEEHIAEVEKINTKHEHIKNIIILQNNYSCLPAIFENVDLNQLLDDALQMLEESLRLHVVMVDKEYDRLEKIKVEKSRLIQVLINLIKNGQEATYGNPPGDRRMKIITSMERGTQDYVTCHIRDNGCGFTAEQKTNLFSFGYTSKKGGFGFGLHSCANYLILRGGTIEARSDGPGLGAEFRIRIPVIKES